MGFDGNSGFSQPIAGALGALLINSLKSPNFVANTTGWMIDKNGNAQFNGATFTGVVSENSDTLLYRGTPAAGTLFLSMSAAGGTDTYGNTYGQGLRIYDVNQVPIITLSYTGQFWLNDPGAGYAVMQVVSSLLGSPQLSFVASPTTSAVAAYIQAIMNGSAEELATFGPKSNSSIDTALSYVTAYLSGGTTAVPAQGTFTYKDNTYTFNPLTFGKTGAVLLGVASAIHPASSPPVAESWQSPTLGSGWTSGFGPGPGQPIRYRLLPDQNVEVIGAIHATSGSPATPWTFPAAYRPTNEQRAVCCVNNGGTPGVCFVDITTAGVVSATPNPGSGGDLYMSFRYPLA